MGNEAIRRVKRAGDNLGYLGCKSSKTIGNEAIRRAKRAGIFGVFGVNKRQNLRE